MIHLADDKISIRFLLDNMTISQLKSYGITTNSNCNFVMGKHFIPKDIPTFYFKVDHKKLNDKLSKTIKGNKISEDVDFPEMILETND
jgi:hypothetical protein